MTNLATCAVCGRVPGLLGCVGHEPVNQLFDAQAATETVWDNGETQWDGGSTKWDFDWHAWVKTPAPDSAPETKEWLEKIRVLLLAPQAPAPETVKTLETLRTVRDRVEKMFLEWRQERVGWEGLSEEVLGSDESGTARWLYNVLRDLDELVLRHEKALLGLIEEGE